MLADTPVARHSRPGQLLGVPADDRLEAYRAKRTPARTPEPFGAAAVPGGHLYSMQKHAATRTHWDLRLEHDGVLLSWAVPKGPSPDPADKRLAVRTEDHPLDYADFEGVIPEGNYGAGSVIVWDRGVWVPLDDVDEGLESGKLLFELRGYKLHGRWTLVKTKQDEKSWLFIKEKDAYVDEGGTGALPDDSIYSGLRVEQVAEKEARVSEIGERAARLGSRQDRLGAADVEVMLAVRRDEPFTREGWIFEIKYDGYRIVAGRDGDEAVLVSRNGNDLTATFPEIRRAVEGLPFEHLVLDGEVVVHDQRGLPSFSRLQKRGRLQRAADVFRASVELPATFYAFDLLGVAGYDLRGVPLLERKELLRDILPTVGPIRYSDHVAEQGEAVYERATEMGLEGVVAKKFDARYAGGRSSSWVKVRAVKTDDFVVVGFTEPSGSRTGFGALHLAQYDDGEMVYMGRVGTGFTDDGLTELRRRLEELEAPESPVDRGPDLRGGEHHWVRPELVVEVQYKEVTEDGLLRQPSFQRVRSDKSPRECVREEGALEEPARVEKAEEPAREVPFTNLDKVFWPEEGYTKGDLIRYYEKVAGWLLPYLEDRPLVLTRYPDGIDGKSFYQKDAPAWAPDWIRTVSVWSESGERELDYFVAEDVETLVYLANLGTIPLHVWHSRVRSLAHPDWCLLDLDPKDAPFEHVVEVARFLHGLCDEIGLPVYVKTSGSTGLHVMIPLGRQTTYEQSRQLGRLLGRLTVDELSGIATLERVISRREGKVYVDFLQNRHGQLVAAPFAVRPKPGATVSAPLRWTEVTPSLDLRDYTIRSVPRRMRALKDGDPMRPVLDEKPDLLAALGRLMERVEGAG